MDRKRNKWRSRLICGVLTVALVLVFTPQPASATGLDKEGAASGAEAKAAGLRAGLPIGPDITEKAPSESKAAADRLIEQLKSEEAKTLDANLGPPSVDAEVTSIPYKDTRTIDENTHKVKLSAEGMDTSLEYRGYVYKLNLAKGTAYSIDMIFDPPDEFACTYLFLDENSNLLMDESMYAYGSVFVAPRSGAYYLFVTDLGLFTSGGSYTLQIDLASLIKGKVTGRKGKALKNILVLYYSSKKSMDPSDFIGMTLTDGRGRYSIGLIPGSYKLLFYSSGSDYNIPKYRAEYYNNSYSIGKARKVKVGAGKTKSGINVKLSAYRAPKADKKIKSLPFKTSSSVTMKSRDIQAESSLPFKAKVYSARLYAGRTYDLILKGGKGATEPFVWVVDSKGYYAGGCATETGDKKVAAAPLSVSKTDDYRFIVSNYSKFFSMKFSLQISEGFTPGRIAGRVTNKGGHALAYFDVAVFKKYGKRWVSYMGAVTGVDGRYSVGGLKPGKYKVRFSDNYEYSEGGSLRYYREGYAGGTKKRAKGTVVEVYAGGTRYGIDMRY